LYLPLRYFQTSGKDTKNAYKKREKLKVLAKRHLDLFFLYFCGKLFNKE